LPSWDSKTRRNNLWGGLAVRQTAGPSGHTISPHPSSREGHHYSTAGWGSGFLLSYLILHGWADRYDGDLTDFFALQDEITKKVVAAIEPKLLEAEAFARKTVRPRISTPGHDDSRKFIILAFN
ncbi:MAG: hypothetical protein WCD13_19340, partial [Pseudolabrys sp.]